MGGRSKEIAILEVRVFRVRIEVSGRRELYEMKSGEEEVGVYIGS